VSIELLAVVAQPVIKIDKLIDKTSFLFILI